MTLFNYGHIFSLLIELCSIFNYTRIVAPRLRALILLPDARKEQCIFMMSMKFTSEIEFKRIINTIPTELKTILWKTRTRICLAIHQIKTTGYYFRVAVTVVP